MTTDDALAGHVAHLLGLTQFLRTREVTPAGPGSEPNSIAIVGGRGMGKSTLLATTIAQLRLDSSVLVLPVVDPDLFAEGDSLGGWVLALTRDLLEQHPTSNPEMAGPIRDLATLSWDQSILSGSYLSGLAERGLTAEEYARDASKVPLTGVRFAAQWARLLDDVARILNEPGLQLVIPIDDADTNPRLIRSLLSDLRTLGESDRIVAIFAVDYPTLLDALEFSDHYPVAAQRTKESRTRASKTLTKYFPRSLRVTLDGIRVKQRLAFTPLGRHRTLLEVLESFPTPDGESNLAEIFQVRAQSGTIIATSPYVECLSSSPRDLVQLHESLELIDATSEDSYAQALLTILQQGVESIESEIAHLSSRPISIEYEAETPLVRFDMGQLVFGRVTNRPTTIYRREDGSDPSDGPRLAQVIGRAGSRFYVHERDEEDQSPASLPDQLAYLSFLAWEACQFQEGGRAALDAQIVQGVTVAGGRGWQDHVSGWEKARWSYWTVPPWEEYTDYFVFMEGWNRILTAIRDLDESPWNIFEWTFIAHLRLVTSVQLRRRVPDDIAAINAAFLKELPSGSDWVALRGELLEAVKDDLAAAYKPGHTAKSQRDADLDAWLEGLLLLQANRSVCTAFLSDWLEAAWREITGDKQAILDEAGSMIARSATQQLASEVAEDDIDLLRRIDPERADRLGSVRANIAERQRTQRANVIRSLTQAGVDEVLVRLLEMEGTTEEVVVGLMAAGVSPSDFGTIADLFPSTKEPEGDHPITVQA